LRSFIRHDGHVVQTTKWYAWTDHQFGKRFISKYGDIRYARTEFDPSSEPGCEEASTCRPPAICCVTSYYASNRGLVFIRFRCPDIKFRVVGGEMMRETIPHQLVWTLAVSTVVLMHDPSDVLIGPICAATERAHVAGIKNESDYSVLVFELQEEPGDEMIAHWPTCFKYRGYVDAAWADEHATRPDVREQLAALAVPAPPAAVPAPPAATAPSPTRCSNGAKHCSADSPCLMCQSACPVGRLCRNCRGPCSTDRPCTCHSNHPAAAAAVADEPIAAAPPVRESTCVCENPLLFGSMIGPPRCGRCGFRRHFYNPAYDPTSPKYRMPSTGGVATARKYRAAP
jgi:hypothetical protein